MVDNRKQSALVERLNIHLRKTARQLIQFETLDETLLFLVNAFWKQFSCDYVSIIFLEGDHLYKKVAKGKGDFFESIFPLHRTGCSSRFLESPVWCYDIIKADERCRFYESIEAERFATWFTVPIKEQDSDSYGVCLIGFRSFVPLFEDANRLFVEFGKDIVSAIGIAMNKQKEKKKLEGMEWLQENVSLGSSLEKLVGSAVERAGKGTEAEAACMYLFDEAKSCFVLHPAAYGFVTLRTAIKVEHKDNLYEYFPFLDRYGENETTVPLIVNLKTVGVLHVKKKPNRIVTQEDTELLHLISSHVSVLIENARLYKNERESKARLAMFMEHQKELVKQTLIGEGFSEITSSLSQMIEQTVILFDRFVRTMVFAPIDASEHTIQSIVQKSEAENHAIRKSSSMEQWFSLEDGSEFGLFTIRGGGELHGYLAIQIPKDDVDAVLHMTLNHALNVYATQFIKQKLILDAKDQVKESFLNQLFVPNIQDKERVIQYANLFKLNVFEPHKVAIISFSFEESIEKESDLMEIEAKKTLIWERFREHLSRHYPSIVATRKEGLFILIVPDQGGREEHLEWERVYNQLKKITLSHEKGAKVYLGISSSTQKIDHYYRCYKEAMQALKIAESRFQHKGFIDFDSLGSYIVLSNLQDTMIAEQFIDNYLGPLLKTSKGKGKELFDTLRVYLVMNGNLKETSEHLFIHRSSLKYRLERISELLKVDLEDAEERFNLMLAYKLHDFYRL